MKHRSADRGFVLIDAIAGLALLMTLSVVLAVTIGQRQRASARLSDTRQAARLAERTLIDLQYNRAVAADPQVVVTNGEPVAGAPALRWTSVTATVNNRTVTLHGVTGRTP